MTTNANRPENETHFNRESWLFLAGVLAFVGVVVARLALPAGGWWA